MASPYYFNDELKAVPEKLERQTQEQFYRNYAQTGLHVYELSDAQLETIYVAAMGCRSVYTEDWVPGRCVYINSEVVLRLKPRGTTTLTVLPFTYSE